MSYQAKRNIAISRTVVREINQDALRQEAHLSTLGKKNLHTLITKYIFLLKYGPGVEQKGVILIERS